MGHILQAHLEKRSRHPSGAVYDFISEYSTRDGAGAWGEGRPGTLVRSHSDVVAWSQFQASAARTDYVDVHGWVFMPGSFRLLIETAHGLGLSKLREASYHPTIGCEFFVILSEDGAGPGLSVDALRRLSEEEQLACLLERFNLLPGRVRTSPADAPGGEAVGRVVVDQLRGILASHAKQGAPADTPVTDPRGPIAESASRIVTLSDQLASAHRDIALMRAQIEAYERSTSWRVMGPARALIRLARSGRQEAA
jgi:hypothetical protein